MSIKREVCNTADELFAMVSDLDGPRDAAMALLMAHVQMTMSGGTFDRDAIDEMLREYSQLFKTAYFGERPS